MHESKNLYIYSMVSRKHLKIKWKFCSQKIAKERASLSLSVAKPDRIFSPLFVDEYKQAVKMFTSNLGMARP